MDPMLQRLGDVTIQRLDKPKENKVGPQNDGDTLEKEKNETSSPESAPLLSTVNIDDIQGIKRNFEDLPGPSSKRSRFEDVGQYDNFSMQSYSDNEMSDYELDSDMDSEAEPDMNMLAMASTMATVSKPKLPEILPLENENTNSNFGDESQENNTDYLDNVGQEQEQQEPFLGEDEIKQERADEDYEYDIKEKLKEMGEISFETVKKGDSKPKKLELKENEVSVVATKKAAGEEEGAGERKGVVAGGNLRRNIREVMDETKLEESTLAAQRQEVERLRRVQEQQRLIRDMQRQMAQERVISMLQGNNAPKASTSGSTRIGNTVLVKLPNGQTKPMTKLNKKPLELMRVPKGAMPLPQKPRQPLPMKKLPPPPQSQAHLTPSVSIAPVGKRPMTLSRPPSESDSDNEESVLCKPLGRPKQKETPVATIDISSDDDCIVVSESENDPTSEEVEDPTNSGMHTNDEFNQPDEQGRVVINIGHPEDEDDIYLAPQIARIIKPHQIGGIRFLYDNIIESTKRFEHSTGFGCILAHSMGLGKTLQVVTFSDIFLRHTPARTILCIMPINTLQNWLAEYNMWVPTEEASGNSPLLATGEVRPRNFNLHVLNDSHKTLAARAKVIQEWKTAGGVLLIGYEQYRLLSLRKYPKSRSKKPEQRVQDEDKNKILFDEVTEALVKPGPDLVICDEGHRIKNSHASISQALKQMRTKRRVVLTGYPLQNNLMEYWCMVDFVRPNYLGTKTEFCNMFERPIQNGQCIDSTEADIKLMRYRAHVLHSLLVGFVQRRSHRVLQTALPQKEEYVLLLRLTDFQRTLYATFMNEVVRQETVPNPLKAFAVCCKIWNHPDVLYNFLKKQAKGEAVDIDLEEVSNSTVVGETPTKTKSRAKRPSRAKNAKPAASVTPYNTNSCSENCPQPNPTPVSQAVPGNNFSNQSSSNQNPPTPNFNSNTTLNTSNANSNFSEQSLTSSNSQNFRPQSNTSFSNPTPESGSFPNNQNTNFSDSSQSQNFTNFNNNVQNSQFTNTSSNFNEISSPNSQNFQQQNQYNSNTSFNASYNQNSFSNGVQINQINSSSGQSFPAKNNQSTSQSNFNSRNSNFTHPPNQNFNSNPSGSHNYNTPATPPFRNNSANFGTNQTFNPQTPPTFQNQANINQEQNFNYPNQNFWNIPPEVKQEGGYFNNFNQSYNNQFGNQWIKKEDIKPVIKTEITSPDSKPKINILSDIQITNVYDSKGNISSEKKINILSDIKIEPKKELEFGDEIKHEFKPDVMHDFKANMPLEFNHEFKREPFKMDPDEDVKILNDPVTPVKGTPMPPKEDTSIPYDWAKELMKDYIPGCIENSSKMKILFCIIKESLALSDRLLVFSQSLITLDLIEQFLQMNIVPGETQHWAKNVNYYRLDGSTSALEREKLINEFNSNSKVYLFLVSTRAGSLGINLIGANRVVVLDASWNPCHDTQAVCRVYRYGQKKPCFVYRLVVDKCLEKKIYDRQINKQGMSDRVVDECNPDAHLTMKDVSTLCWDDEDEVPERDWSFTKENYSDTVLRRVLEQNGRGFNKEPFQHESLLIDRKEKQLSQQEKRLAKKGYEREKQASRAPSYAMVGNARGHRPVASVRPMQQGERPTRWIPAEHWQRQGMTAQEMTLPLDVVIPTNQPDKGNIVLKAGQKVLVLKSPKGVYMQLESGKIVAIKTAIKVRGKAEDEANKVKASLPPAIKNNTAISVLPPKRPMKPFSPSAISKLSMRNLNKAVPNLVNQMHKVSKKVQMTKSRPFEIGNEIAKAVRGGSDVESHPISSSEDERSPDKRLGFPYRGDVQVSLLKSHRSHSESDDGDIQRSEDDSRGSSKDDIPAHLQHNYKNFVKSKSASSSALQQLEQSTSAIISDSKQPFQETLDSITSSYQDDKSNEQMVQESTSSQPQPIQIEDDSPAESEETYEQSSHPQDSVKTDIPAPEYGYNNYYNYNHVQTYPPPPPPPQGYAAYPPQPPYDMSMYPPPQQQQQPPYNYGMYPQGYPPQPQYPPPPPLQPYDYGAPPPPQPMYGGYPPYPPQPYPPPPQGMYPPPAAAPYPEYQYPPGAPPPVAPATAPNYYPPQT